MKHRFARLFTVSMFVLAVTPAAWAQSGISGAVRDESGGVLPGVQVDARSPVLIEQVRTVYTDGQGLYQVIDLRPGTYTVTFTLQGFKTVIREGIELPAAFTATVDATLDVGGVTESVTVTGAAPLVDTRNVVQQVTVPSEVRDAMPLSSNSAAYVVLIPAAVQVGVDRDVGGIRGEQAQTFSIHGSRVDDLRQLRDGMDSNSLFGAGNRITSINPATVTEIIVLTEADAKAEGMGVLVDVVPRDGGNTFRGTFQYIFGDKDLQANNIDDELRGRGVTANGDIVDLYEVQGGFGGPIWRDKLWFYGAARDWQTSALLPGIFFNKRQGTPFFEADLSRPSLEKSFYKEVNARLTWQAAAKHKVSFSYFRDDSCMCLPGQRAGTLAPEAAGNNFFEPAWRTQAKWTHPASSRLLVEAGMSTLNFDVVRGPSGGGPNDFAITDLSRNFTFGHHARAFGPQATVVGGQFTVWNFNTQGNVSYVTGSHNFAAGTHFRLARRTDDHFINNGMTLGFRGNVPAEVTLWASPFLNQVRHRVVALYAQDQWTIRRLTLNLGLRFDHVKGWVPAVEMPAGPFVPARSFAGLGSATRLQDLNPRVGAAYDLFGDGRTAVKTALGRYVFVLKHSDLQPFAPARQTALSTIRTWDDANGNFVPDCDMLNSGANGECGRFDNLNFGRPIPSTQFARDVTHGWFNRPYNWQFSLTVDRELLPGVSVGAGYFRTWFDNFTVTNNLAVTPADFDRFSVTVPSDPRLPTSGQVITELFNQTPASFGRVDRLVVQASEFGDQTQIYNGFDFTARARFPNGANISGGVSVGRTVTDDCEVLRGNPQLLRSDGRQAAVNVPNCRIEPPWAKGTNIRASGIMPLPWDFRVSAVWQNLPQIPTDADFVLAPGVARSELGRNLVGGAPFRTIQLVTPSSFYVEPRANQIDFRVSRRFQVRQLRVEPQFNVFNLTNGNDVLQITSRFGPAWQAARSVLPPRMIKLGIQVDF